MKCDVCGGDTIVYNTRDRKDSYVWRRRKCVKCGARFGTYEFPDTVVQTIISLLDGRQELITRIRNSMPRKINNKCDDDHF